MLMVMYMMAFTVITEDQEKVSIPGVMESNMQDNDIKISCEEKEIFSTRMVTTMWEVFIKMSSVAWGNTKSLMAASTMVNDTEITKVGKENNSTRMAIIMKATDLKVFSMVMGSGSRKMGTDLKECTIMV